VGCGGFLQDDPEAGAEDAFGGTDGAGELEDGEAGVCDCDGESGAAVVYEVAEALGDEDFVNLARRGFFYFVEVVVGEGKGDGEFEGGGGGVGVGGELDGHGRRIVCHRLGRREEKRKEEKKRKKRLLCVRVVGEDGEGAIDLFGQDYAG